MRAERERALWGACLAFALLVGLAIAWGRYTGCMQLEGATWPYCVMAAGG